MLIDCATCIAPEHACRDCVVTFLLDSSVRPGVRTPEASPGVELDDTEQQALAELSAAGLVPPLRLVAAPDAPGNRRSIA
ncbi:MAG TPA: hypothetical protein VFH38_12850 [Jatrophihabitans sp.]|nr:hypothetical protein [Jatrophihabitans sp.]